MNRKNFIASVIGLLASPFVAKAAPTVGSNPVMSGQLDFTPNRINDRPYPSLDELKKARVRTLRFGLLAIGPTTYTEVAINECSTEQERHALYRKQHLNYVELGVFSRHFDQELNRWLPYFNAFLNGSKYCFVPVPTNSVQELEGNRLVNLIKNGEVVGAMKLGNHLVDHLTRGNRVEFDCSDKYMVSFHSQETEF
jgi:hypothetical protein